MQPERSASSPNGGNPDSGRRVFGVCLLAIAALFGGYEIVERTWLAEASPQLLSHLHLLRGLAAAVTATALALVLLRRRLDVPDPSLPPPSAATAWKWRVQHVRMRTKLVLPMALLVILTGLGIGLFIILHARGMLREVTVQRVEFDVAAQAREIQEFLEALQRDLIFLSQSRVIRDLAGVARSERGEALRRQAEREFLIFSQGKRMYYQVRYLNAAGHEVVRLNVHHGQPQVVPPEQLQDKGDRYYVAAAAAVEAGRIYVSPIDLNVEHGKTEEPLRAVVRYATQVMAENGVRGGLLMINVDADSLLSLAGPLAPGIEAWLLNEQMIYVGYRGATGENRRTYALSEQRRLAQDYSSEEIAMLLGKEGRGVEASHSRATAAFAFHASIRVDERAPQRCWHLLIKHPRAPIEMPVRRLTAFLSVATLLMVAVAVVMGVLVAHYLASPVAALRQATRAIAAGDLSRRVAIGTGDEIEGLAGDFNTMTERLQAAQQRLATWNDELAREVAVQTEKIRQLQSGLARVDKLASIGQVTAGVMHEIGNPLAAIKTKIQLAQRITGLHADQRTLLTEILVEVDRLAAFLRSFSRLAHLREPQRKKAVSLAAVVDSVIGLLAPDFRRRQVQLRAEIAADVSPIGGDTDQLRQLLMNLILNAADASSNGGEVVISVRCADRKAILEVVDHGAGISAEILDKIWNPFFTTKPEGTGLGLAISRQIVQEHDGTIQIQSEPGKGAVVTVTFPEWLQ